MYALQQYLEHDTDPFLPPLPYYYYYCYYYQGEGFDSKSLLCLIQ